MKALMLLLIVAVALLAWQAYSQKAVIAHQQERLEALNAKLEARPRTTNIELQEKCAKQALEAYRLSGWDKNLLASFSNHYNEKLNKCFVLIGETHAGGNSESLQDAFEGKVFGFYMWLVKKDKKYWEVPPFRCEVTLISGEKKTCESSDEFDDLVKAYME